MKTNFDVYFTLENVEKGIQSTKAFACYVRNELMNQPCDRPCERCKMESIEWLKESQNKIELSLFEKELLSFYLNSGWKYIARDECGDLFVYNDEPYVVNGSKVWKCEYEFNALEEFNDLFEGITWESQDFYSIESLIK